MLVTWYHRHGACCQSGYQATGWVVSWGEENLQAWHMVRLEFRRLKQQGWNEIKSCSLYSVHTQAYLKSASPKVVYEHYIATIWVHTQNTKSDPRFHLRHIIASIRTLYSVYVKDVDFGASVPTFPNKILFEWPSHYTLWLLLMRSVNKA